MSRFDLFKDSIKLCTDMGLVKFPTIPEKITYKEIRKILVRPPGRPPFRGVDTDEPPSDRLEYKLWRQRRSMRRKRLGLPPEIRKGYFRR